VSFLFPVKERVEQPKGEKHTGPRINLGLAGETAVVPASRVSLVIEHQDRSFGRGHCLANDLAWRSRLMDGHFIDPGVE